MKKLIISLGLCQLAAFPGRATLLLDDTNALLPTQLFYQIQMMP